MKINETQRTGSVQSYRKNSDSKHTNTTGKKHNAKDEVVISSEAKELQGSHVSRKKVDELKNSVATGTYNVESGKIAEKLLPYLK
jgi:negative regulator of flagellin synthesis FlgM